MFEPRLRALHVPPGWETREEISLLAPNGRANVLASSVPLEKPLTTEEYASLHSEQMPIEFRGYKEASFEPAQLLGDKSCWVRDFKWDPPDTAGSVRQLQVYHSDGKRGYTATVTALVADFLEQEAELLQVLRGLRIASATQETAPTP